MKKVLFAMLVSGMLFSCTNNKTEETQAADSTATVTGNTEVQEANEEVQTEATADTTVVEDSTASVQ